jgi:hypothetical protein
LVLNFQIFLRVDVGICTKGTIPPEKGQIPPEMIAYLFPFRDGTGGVQLPGKLTCGVASF